MIIVVIGLVGAAAVSVYLSQSSNSPADLGAQRPIQSTSSSAVPFPLSGTGYLATGTNFVDFIQWKSSDGGILHGTAYELVALGTPPGLNTTTATFEVSGRVVGSFYDLSFDHAHEASANLSKGSFSLDFPQPDGSYAPVEFNLANAAQFASARSILGQHVNNANLAVENAQELEQEQEAIEHDARAVNNEIGALAQDEASTNSYVNEMRVTLGQEASDLATSLTGEQQVASARGTGRDSERCVEAGSVAADAIHVADDDSAVAGESGGVEASLSTINGLRADISDLQAGYSQLQQDEAILPGYSPTGTPTQAQVTIALNEATASVQSSLSATNAYIDQANDDMTTAFSYVDEAYQTGGCGLPATAPPPVQHIS